MNRAALADAFEWDGALLNLWVPRTDVLAWDRAMRALDAAFPCVFRLNGEPAPLPGLDDLGRWANGEEGSAEFHADTVCAAGGTGLEVVFFLNFGLDPMEATLHPLDVPDEAAFERLTRLVQVLSETTGRRVYLGPEDASFRREYVWASFFAPEGWSLAQS